MYQEKQATSVKKKKKTKQKFNYINQLSVANKCL